MKILSLSFANINSLAGEWHIDFTDPAFADGLFALVGPTGSGKTSILDAISLSLFGRTVRQGSISKETNEVMTRGTGFAHAETEFESKGKRYLSRWEQGRARKKPSAALQLAKRTLSSDGKTIHDSLRGMDDAIRSALGLTFEQFTRSVLLAQGQFDAFLKADDKDRSDILEQATGTEIYSQLGAKIFERWQRERDKTKELESLQQAVQTLPPEERTALEADLAGKTDEQKTLAAAIQALEAQAIWLTQLASLRKQRDALRTEQAQLDADQQAAQSGLAALARAETARSFDVEYNGLENLRKKTASSKTEVTERETRLKQLESELSVLAPKIQAAQESAQSAQDTLDAHLPILAQTRELLGEIRTRDAELNAARKAEDAAREILAETQRLIGIASQEIAENQAALVSAADERRQLEERFDTAKTDLVPLASALAAANAEKETAESTRNIRKPDLNLARDRADEALLLAQKVASLETERCHLEDGKPCPLCGAAAHPYASGNTPRVSDERKHIKDITAQINALDEAVESSRKKADAAGQAHRKQEQEIQNLQDSVREIAKNIEILQIRIGELQKRQNQLAAQKQANESDLNGKTQERTACETAADALNAKRAALFPGDPDAEEKRLRDALKSASDERQRLDAQRNTLTAYLETAKQELADAISRRDASTTEEQQAADALSKKWADAGFPDGSGWLAARLSDADLARFRVHRQSLSERTASLQGRTEQNTRDIAAEEAKALTDRPNEEVAAELAQKTAARDDQQKTLGELTQRKRSDDENVKRKTAQGDALGRQRIIAAKWDNLNKWAGGANGEQFKRYAQGITLRRLLTLATPHVAHMTRDRYELVWDAASKELLPDIIDREQGDARRAVSNLSGGETFMISLALALGLSAMSSERLNVDTLFLDEGFGTLDDEALSTALDTLTGLKQDGKLIGVISHVQAVKDQIAAQIRIHPGPGGRSTLSGPGVTRLNS